ncbi:hypothetical protein BJ508DRAFT_334802 [Ascobolus immersus RN42]|uniref:GAG-pre-integrase domain-containing protein n=1 Tax=Ascobolus immersus RN42 TaxID=1160509 RepID=A0A3N4HEN7_ASCIM|nr:hypothetical protein BJ508DRAFT_334802 [Ascobolus immersus RN42]
MYTNTLNNNVNLVKTLMTIFQGSPILHDKSDYQPWKDAIMGKLTLAGALGLADGTDKGPTIQHVKTYAQALIGSRPSSSSTSSNLFEGVEGILPTATNGPPHENTRRHTNQNSETPQPQSPPTQDQTQAQQQRTQAQAEELERQRQQQMQAMLSQAKEEWKTKKQTIFILIKDSLAAEIKYRGRPYTETHDIKGLLEDLKATYSVKTLGDVSHLYRGYLLAQMRDGDHPNETVAQYNERLREKRERLVTGLGGQLDPDAMRAVLYLEAMHTYYPSEVKMILDSPQTGATPGSSGGEDFRSLSLDHVMSRMETLTSMSSEPASLKVLKISVTGSNQHGGGPGKKGKGKGKGGKGRQHGKQQPPATHTDFSTGAVTKPQPPQQCALCGRTNYPTEKCYSLATAQKAVREKSSGGASGPKDSSGSSGSILRGNKSRLCRIRSARAKAAEMEKKSGVRFAPWGVDSGTNEPMTSDLSVFDAGTFKRFQKPVITINPNLVYKEVLYVPVLGENLLPTFRECGKNRDLMFCMVDRTCDIIRDDKIIVTATRDDDFGLYILYQPLPNAQAPLSAKLATTRKRKAKSPPTYAQVLTSGIPATPATLNGLSALAARKKPIEIKKEEARQLLSYWHVRLGHCSIPRMRQMALENLVEGMPTKQIITASGYNLRMECEACRLGKAVQHHHTKSAGNNQPTEPLQRLHLDVCGPWKVPTLGSSRCSYKKSGIPPGNVPSLVVASVRRPDKPDKPTPLLRTLTSIQRTPQLSHLLDSSLVRSRDDESETGSLAHVHVLVAQYNQHGSLVTEAEVLAEDGQLRQLALGDMSVLPHLAILRRQQHYQPLRLLQNLPPDSPAGQNRWTQEWMSITSRGSILESCQPTMPVDHALHTPLPNKHDLLPPTLTDPVIMRQPTPAVTPTPSQHRKVVNGPLSFSRVRVSRHFPVLNPPHWAVVEDEDGPSSEERNSSIEVREIFEVEDGPFSTEVRSNPEADREAIETATLLQSNSSPIANQVPTASNQRPLEAASSTASPAEIPSSDSERHVPPLSLIRDAIKLYTAANGIKLGAKWRVTKVKAETPLHVWQDLALCHPSPFYSKDDLIELTNRFNLQFEEWITSKPVGMGASVPTEPVLTGLRAWMNSPSRHSPFSPTYANADFSSIPLDPRTRVRWGDFTYHPEDHSHRIPFAQPASSDHLPEFPSNPYGLSPQGLRSLSAELENFSYTAPLSQPFTEEYLTEHPIPPSSPPTWAAVPQPPVYDYSNEKPRGRSLHRSTPLPAPQPRRHIPGTFFSSSSDKERFSRSFSVEEGTAQVETKLETLPSHCSSPPWRLFTPPVPPSSPILRPPIRYPSVPLPSLFTYPPPPPLHSPIPTPSSFGSPVIGPRSVAESGRSVEEFVFRSRWNEGPMESLQQQTQEEQNQEEFSAQSTDFVLSSGFCRELQDEFEQELRQAEELYDQVFTQPPPEPPDPIVLGSAASFPEFIAQANSTISPSVLARDPPYLNFQGPASPSFLSSFLSSPLSPPLLPTSHINDNMAGNVPDQPPQQQPVGLNPAQFQTFCQILIQQGNTANRPDRPQWKDNTMGVFWPDMPSKHGTGRRVIIDGVPHYRECGPFNQDLITNGQRFGHALTCLNAPTKLKGVAQTWFSEGLSPEEQAALMYEPAPVNIPGQLTLPCAGWRTKLAAAFPTSNRSALSQIMKERFTMEQFMQTDASIHT